MKAAPTAPRRAKTDAPLVSAPLLPEEELALALVVGAEAEAEVGLEEDEPAAEEAEEEAPEEALETAEEALEAAEEATEVAEASTLEADSVAEVEASALVSGMVETEVMVMPTAAQSARAAAFASSRSLGSEQALSKQAATAEMKAGLEHMHLLSVGSQPMVSAPAMQDWEQLGKL